MEKRPRDLGLAKLDVHRGDKVLEIGFGTGNCLLPLARSVGDSGKVYGLDMSEGMLGVAAGKLEKAGLSDRVDLQLGDAVNLPYPDRSFDAIFMSFVLELFDTPEIPLVLQQCRRALKAGGRICIVAMSKERNPTMLSRFYQWAHRKFPDYVDCRPIHVREAVKSAGFEIADVTRYRSRASRPISCSPRNWRPRASRREWPAVTPTTHGSSRPSVESNVVFRRWIKLETKTGTPTLEDVLELSGIELLHPGGFDITRRIGEIVEMKGKKVLDVSCGRGILPAYYAKSFSARIVGIDLSPEMIKSSTARAKKEGVEDLTEFEVADSLALPFGDGSFDVVVNECAVGLTVDPQKRLNEMTRVTKPGGYVVIHESTWLKEVSQEEKAGIARRLGTVPYTLAEWKGMLASAGLTDLWVEDWSAPENALKIRPDRRVRNPSDVFSPWEMVSTILPRLIFRYGVGSLSYVYESTKTIYPLYQEGTLGYFLLRGQKP